MECAPWISNTAAAPSPTARDRAPARAMLKAIGLTDDDLAKPIIGIANTWIEIDAVQLPPARPRRARSRRASARPAARRWSSTPSPISDGITMGTEGMKASLVSREVIADSIELMGRGHMFDAHHRAGRAATRPFPAPSWRCSRLDVPGVDALRRLDRCRASFKGRDITIQDVFEAVGAYAAGTSATPMYCARSRTLPVPARAPAAASSPPTPWPWPCELLGLSPMGQRQRAADGQRTRTRSPTTAASWSSTSLQRGAHAARRSSPARASRTPSPASPPPADPPTPCCTCSPSRARPASRSTIDDFDAHQPATPLLVDLKPAGQFVAVDLYKAGGMALVAQRLARSRRAASTARAHRHRPHASPTKPRAPSRRPGQEVVRAARQPRSRRPAAW